MNQLKLVSSLLLLIFLLVKNVGAKQFELENAASRLIFHSSIEGNAFSGVFSEFQSIAEVNENNELISVSLEIPLIKVTTDESQRDEMLKQSPFFDTTTFPLARFKSSSIALDSPNGAIISGIMNINGIKKFIEIHSVIHRQGKKLQLQGSTDLSRKIFNVGTGDFADESVIPDKVNVEFLFNYELLTSGSQ